jgi:hypothetical protein
VSNRGKDWTEDEVERIVRDYFDMLREELRGARVNKTAHRTRLRLHVDRSDKSIEFKRMNVSAVLALLGFPHVTGYRPAFHYQGVLATFVDRYLQAHPELQVDLQSRPEGPPHAWLEVRDRPPAQVEVLAPTGGLPRERRTASRLAREEEMLQRETRNRKLGRAGEEFVLNHERLILSASRHSELAAEVKWAAKERGEGLGYDILSFDVATGAERFIEVKTTNLQITTPFFVSANEVDFSRKHADSYELARVFDYYDAPCLFRLRGAVDKTCELNAASYRAAAI